MSAVRRAPRSADRIVRRHLVATVGVVTVVMLVALVVQWRLASAEADRITRDVSSRVAAEVSDILAGSDLSTSEPDAASLDAQLEGYFSTGSVARVKVWRVEGDRVRVVYSDDRRLVGDERPFSFDLADRLSESRIVVTEVPVDAEHRFENAEGWELREAYVAFEDAAGTELRLEVYVHVHRDEWIASVLAVYVPAMIVGVAVLIAVLLPLSTRLARRLREAESERRGAVDYALRSRERERVRLARRLHDDVLQSLSGVQLALDAIADAEAKAGARHPDDLRRMSRVLAGESRALRRLVDEHLPHDGVDPIEAAFEEIAADAAAAGVACRFEAAGATDLGDARAQFLADAARELVRNVIAHAEASSLQLSLRNGPGGATLVVSDDGIGLDSASTWRSGHGLRLLERAVHLEGGSLEVTGGMDAGVVARVELPGAASGDAGSSHHGCRRRRVRGRQAGRSGDLRPTAV